MNFRSSLSPNMPEQMYSVCDLCISQHFGDFVHLLVSAIGPKQTWARALHMSAFGAKADLTLSGCPLFRSLLGVKQTSLVAAHMSACDPKRTSGTPFLGSL